MLEFDNKIRLGVSSHHVWGVFTSRLKSVWLVTETEKFRLPVGELSQLTYSQLEFSSLCHKSKAFNLVLM